MEAERILRGSRLERHEYFLQMAELVAQRSTCARRAVGCVIVNAMGHVMSTGYNGVCRGVPHCIDSPCAGARLPSGQGLSTCEAIHAEENALMQCHDITQIETVYCTASPCIGCMRKLANTAVQNIVFRELYPHPGSMTLADQLSITMWHKPHRDLSPVVIRS